MKWIRTIVAAGVLAGLGVACNSKKDEATVPTGAPRPEDEKPLPTPKGPGEGGSGPGPKQRPIRPG